MPGIMTAMSACVGCGNVFEYDPDQVPSLLYARSAGTSFELAVAALQDRHAKDHGTEKRVADCGSCAPAYDALGRGAVREPVCPSCAKAANPERARRGFELIPEHDTAAALMADPWNL